jgi:hypothetical protein
MQGPLTLQHHSDLHAKVASDVVVSAQGWWRGEKKSGEDYTYMKSLNGKIYSLNFKMKINRSHLLNQSIFRAANI